MSNANNLNVATKQQDTITAGSLAVAKVLTAGQSYALHRGGSYFLNCETGAGAVALTLPNTFASVSGGVSAEIYAYADPGRAGSTYLTITAPTGAITLAQHTNQTTANSVSGDPAALIVKTNLSGDSLTLACDGAGAANCRVRIASVGTQGGYMVSVESTNTTSA